jgi:hypothetical protein
MKPSYSLISYVAAGRSSRRERRYPWLTQIAVGLFTAAGGTMLASPVLHDEARWFLAVALAMQVVALWRFYRGRWA